jgi:hypothetical protein
MCTWIYRDHGLTTPPPLRGVFYYEEGLLIISYPEKKVDIQSFVAVYSYLSMLRKLKVVA